MQKDSRRSQNQEVAKQTGEPGDQIANHGSKRMRDTYARPVSEARQKPPFVKKDPPACNGRQRLDLALPVYPMLASRRTLGPCVVSPMQEPLDPAEREELFELYSELHLACACAATALRLAANWDAPESELLDRFRAEEARAERIWQRIRQLQKQGGA